MLVSIYSGRSCWVTVPAKHKPPPSSVTACGSLIFESTVPSALVSDEIWKRFRADIDRQGFSQVSEDMGLHLMDECMERYGTIRVLCEDAPGRVF